MESVVVTVTGYHGSERFKLIKLISQSGANYVGAMNRSTTHLVCLKFEGRKYDLAKKLEILIVNHRWVEDCIKQGRRVPENPFLLQSGEEVGPLFLEVPIVAEENLSSELGTSNNSHELNEGVIKKISKCGCSSSKCYQGTSLYKILGMEAREQRSTNSAEPHRRGHRFLNEEPSFCSCMLLAKEQRNTNSAEPHRRGHRLRKKNIMECTPSGSEQESYPTSEEPSSPSKLLAREKKGTTSAETRCRGRRLVKKNTTEFAPSDTELESYPTTAHHQFIDLTTPPNHLNDTRDKKRLRITATSTNSLDESGGNRNAGFEDTAEVEDLSGPKLDAGVAPSTLERTLQNLCSNVNENVEGNENIARMRTSTDLSCVICWTEFSSTRGVLPCGHRFCFSCIQSWADLMASRRKTSTCPLCKASFVSITKVDDAASIDQKIYSQTVPSDSSAVDVFILPNGEIPTSEPQPLPTPVVCSECCSREPEDLLVKCHLCNIRCIHSYCLDPFLLPWTCTHCKDLQMLYHHFR